MLIYLFDMVIFHSYVNVYQRVDPIQKQVFVWEIYHGIYQASHL